MALSDCPKCWNTPCTCGHQYKHCSVEYLDQMIQMLEKVKNKKGGADMSAATMNEMERLRKERDEYREHLSVISEMTGNGSDIGAAHEAVNAIIEQRDAALEREQALAAHMLAVMDARDSKRGDTLENMLAVLNGGPSCLDSLTKHDLIKQAEELENSALHLESIDGCGIELGLNCAVNELNSRALELRQQAAAL